MTDRLIRDTKRRMERAGNREPDEEETFTYQERRKPGNLNEEKGVFEQKAFGGINTQQSVFDRTAVFRKGSAGDAD